MRTSFCDYCGHSLIFTRTIRRGVRVITRRNGGCFVFCSNRNCPRK